MTAPLVPAQSDNPPIKGNSMSEEIQSALDGVSLDETEAVLVVSLKKTGEINISSSLNNVAAMHWMLNKAVFELNVFERNQAQTKDATAEEEAA
jgi:hypothetical protein